MAQPRTQYRINKSRAYANFIDFNKDGYISKDDYEMVAVNIVRLQNASEERAKGITMNFVNCLKMVQPPSQYRINKFRTYFNFVDLNKDGYLNIDDYELVAVNMARLQNASEEQTKQLRAEFTQWWDVASGGKLDQNMKIEDVLQITISYYSSTDVRVIQERVCKTYKQMFDLIDANGDDLISREELKIFYNSYGFTDGDSIRRVFDRIDTDKNGVISRDEFVSANSAFWLSDDPKTGYQFLYDPLL